MADPRTRFSRRKIAFKTEGENVSNALNPQLEKLVKDYKDAIDTKPFVFKVKIRY